MKKMMISLCLILFIPAMSHAALVSSHYYQTSFFTTVPESGPVSGTIAFGPAAFQQGVMSIEYATGDIGTGAYSSKLCTDISGSFDFYDANSDYYRFDFIGTSTLITIAGVGKVQNFSTGKTFFGFFFGVFSGAMK